MGLAADIHAQAARVIAPRASRAGTRLAGRQRDDRPSGSTGATRLYAIIGDPIAQVRSPEVFTERFAAAGIDAVLVPAHVPAERFDAIVPALMALGNLDGLLVTVPFKARMASLRKRLGCDGADCIGAVNALRREADGTWTGDMFDGAGFVRGARAQGRSALRDDASRCSARGAQEARSPASSRRQVCCRSRSSIRQRRAR